MTALIPFPFGPLFHFSPVVVTVVCFFFYLNLVCWRRGVVVTIGFGPFSRDQVVSKCSRLRARHRNRRPPTRGVLLLPLLLLLLVLLIRRHSHSSYSSRRFHLVGNCFTRRRLPPHCPLHPPTPASTRRHVWN